MIRIVTVFIFITLLVFSVVAYADDANQNIPSKQELEQQLRESSKEENLNSTLKEVDYFEYTKWKLDSVAHNTDKIGSTGELLVSVPLCMVVDVLCTPIKLSKRAVYQIQGALRPGTWGNPDSMIAKAFRQQKTIAAPDEQRSQVAMLR